MNVRWGMNQFIRLHLPELPSVLDCIKKDIFQNGWELWNVQRRFWEVGSFCQLCKRKPIRYIPSIWMLSLSTTQCIEDTIWRRNKIQNNKLKFNEVQGITSNYKEISDMRRNGISIRNSTSALGVMATVCNGKAMEWIWLCPQ